MSGNAVTEGESVFYQEPGTDLTSDDIERLKFSASFCFGSVLDIGCGNKALQKYLSPICTYTGIDPQFGDPTADSLGNIPDKSFDTVVMLEVLEHLPNPVKALKEAKRVCKWRIVLSVPNPWNLDQIASLIAHDTNIVNPNHVALFGDNEIRAICKNAGIEHVTPYRFYTRLPGFRVLLPIKSRFGEWSFYICI